MSDGHERRVTSKLSEAVGEQQLVTLPGDKNQNVFGLKPINKLAITLVELSKDSKSRVTKIHGGYMFDLHLSSLEFEVGARRPFDDDFTSVNFEADERDGKRIKSAL